MNKDYLEDCGGIPYLGLEISFEDAYEIEKAHKEHIDNYTELEEAWVFSFYDDSNYIGGYGHVPVIVLKKTGEVRFSMPDLLMGTYGKELSSGELK